MVSSAPAGTIGMTGSKVRPAIDPTFGTAAEKEHPAWRERKDRGVPVNAALQNDLNVMRRELGLPHRFPWDA